MTLKNSDGTIRFHNKYLNICGLWYKSYSWPKNEPSSVPLKGVIKSFDIKNHYHDGSCVKFYVVCPKYHIGNIKKMPKFKHGHLR